MSGDKPAGEDLARSLATVMQAAMGVGSALARGAAEATAQGRPVAPPAAEAGAVAGIIHYSAAALGNIVALAGAATGPGSAQGPGQSAAPPRSGPVVRAGAGLRVPLSIENPGTEPMQDITPRLARLEQNGQDVTALVPEGAVRFVPEQLNVAPRDFEKLTVFLGVPAAAPEGVYRATIALGEGFGEVAIDFTVRAPAAG